MGHEPGTFNFSSFPPHSHYDDTNVASILSLMIVGIFGIVVLFAFWLFKFIRLQRMRRLGYNPNGSVARGVDLVALELHVPSCRPVIIGAPQTHNEHEVEPAEMELGSENSSESGVQCAVCLRHLEKGEEARSLPCQHIFHRICIDSWLSKSRQCPVCRQLVGIASTTV